MAKDTPVLALPGLVLLFVFRNESKRELQASMERKLILEDFSKVINHISNDYSELSKSINLFVQANTELHHIQSQSLSELNISHTQMIKVLGRLNGK
ncbi:hypothetical protein H8E77_39725 [bacterium]|nr:hypothetical protein [bacterium]